MKARISIALATLFALSPNTPLIAWAQSPFPVKKDSRMALPQSGTARISDLFGKVAKKPLSASDYTTLSVPGVLTPQTMIRTGDDSAMLLILSDGSKLRVGEKTVVVLNELGKGKFSCKLLSGQVWSLVSDSSTRFEVSTSSAVVHASAKSLFGVGYELESNQSIVSTGEGSVNVALSSGGWEGTVPTGKQVRYLRNPEPNIRLRAPQILTQDQPQKTMWSLLRMEDWTKPNLPGGNDTKLKRGQEKQLRGLNFSVTVDK